MIKTIKFLKDEKGASELIETSFMLQIILMLVFGFIFFSWAVREDVIIESAARSGARQHGITWDSADAIEKAERELAIGGVRGASVYIKDNKVIIEKPYNIKVPFAQNYIFGIRKSHTFHKEEETFYYNKPPEEQVSPVDKKGYSGYTGNPYR